jgi:hypothetical protein
MPRANFTDIIVLLDRSSSMQSIAKATRDGLNEFIKSQQLVAGEARFTLVQFSTTADFKYTLQQLPVGAVEPLTELQYNPRGAATALRDALGRLIDDLGRRYAAEREHSRPEKVVLVVVTDGEENASRNITPEALKTRIQTQSDVYKWEFVYLGANQDAILAAREMSIPVAAAMDFAASEQGVNAMYASVSEKLGTYRTGLSRSMAFDDDDRKKAAGK